jgi:DNA-binding transcriptional ArsR family regulator
MSNYNYQPLPTIYLETEKQIRAYVNPTRMAILVLLAKDKLSVSKVAQAFEVHPANLTHHFKILEQAGLIQLVEKKETGKNLEKLYRATAYQYIVNPENESVNKQVLGLSILRDSLNAAIPALRNQKDDKDVLAVIKTVRIEKKDLKKFESRLLELAAEFEKNSSSSGDTYSLNISLYPTDAGNTPAQEVSIRI